MNLEIEKLFKKVLKRKKSNAAQVWVAAAAGIGVGAIIGLLFAPESGRDLRERLCASCNNEVEDVVDNVKENIKEKMPSTKDNS